MSLGLFFSMIISGKVIKQKIKDDNYNSKQRFKNKTLNKNTYFDSRGRLRNVQDNRRLYNSTSPDGLYYVEKDFKTNEIVRTIGKTKEGRLNEAIKEKQVISEKETLDNKISAKNNGCYYYECIYLDNLGYKKSCYRRLIDNMEISEFNSLVKYETTYHYLNSFIKVKVEDKYFIVGCNIFKKGVYNYELSESEKNYFSKVCIDFNNKIINELVEKQKGINIEYYITKYKPILTQEDFDFFVKNYSFHIFN